MIIYKITNTTNQKVYIGQTTQTISRRMAGHFCNTTRNIGYLQKAIKKYGKDSFIVEVLATAESQNELNDLEIEYIKLENSVYPNGYNLTFGGEGGKKSEEAKKNMALGQKGKISGRKGKTYGPNSKPYSSESRFGKSRGRYSSNGNIGRSHTNQAKLNMSLAKLGKPAFHSMKAVVAHNIATGEQISFTSINKASEVLNIKRTAISNVLNKWSKKSQNYTFTFALENERGI